MTIFYRLSKPNRAHKSLQKEEQGVSLVISLLMGVILITGVTGLLIRQIAAKKSASSESYQQMAEIAASNGFNRILAVLNNASTAEYRGFLFTEDNEPDSWIWNTPYEKGQYCSGLAGLPIYTDASGSTEAPWPVSPDGYKLNEESMRGDGKGVVLTTYRLRSYSSTFSEGQGTGTFEVEGFVRRIENNGNNDNNEETTSPLLARARLTRSLQLESAIARPDDWGVVATQTSNLLGSSGAASLEIKGPGRLVWYTSMADRDLCNKKFNNISGQSTDVVWPVLRDNNSQFIPASSFYNRDGTVDQASVNGKTYNRVWSFDDTDPTICGWVACTSPGNTQGRQPAAILQNQELLQEEGSSQSDSSNTGSIDNYKTIKKHWRGKWFKIGTCKIKDIDKAQENCESDDTGSKDWSWSDKYYRSDKIDGSVITIWRWKDKNKGTIEVGTCIENNAIDCDLGDNMWDWNIPTEGSSEPTAESDSEANVNYTLKIDSDDICTNNNSSDVCHIFIEKLNLTKTQLFIKNDTRAIVLHLNVGENTSRANYQYTLRTNAQLCGVNSLAGATPTCNLKPAQLVITQDRNSELRSCPTDQAADDFLFTGVSLPAAWVSFNTGRVRPVNASMQGVIWASSLCAQGDLTVTSENSGGTAFVDQAKTYWNIPTTGGIGRRIVRGIRGSGFDIFKRW
ncbi:hypothetical protein [Synechococcus sp. CC9616]|uniref:type IV pilus modification PilV family protein n=1 Tax=Synechococcus sp. CC9616 TaxID=110663 RepID=UPI0004AF0FFD|nr:hypothetical protein [Synechococcus sp. CC9616]